MKLLLRLNVLSMLILISSNGYSQTIPEEKKEAIKQFIQLVENENWAQLAKTVNYPLKRPYPVPNVESEAEFLVRRTELMDDNLINMVISSFTDSTSSWTESMKKDLVMKDGLLSLDSLGMLTAIRYETVYTKELKKELIELDRQSLPVALQEYERPVLQMQTEKFRIRIDETKGPSYRLVVWILGARNPNVPAVNVIPNGVFATFPAKEAQTYTFESDFGTFVCLISKYKEDGSLPADLLLYRDNELVRAYPAISFQN